MLYNLFRVYHDYFGYGRLKILGRNFNELVQPYKKNCDKIIAFEFKLVIFIQCLIATRDDVLPNCFLMIVYNAKC